MVSQTLQVDTDDLERLRDHVLMPAMAQWLSADKPDPAAVAETLALVAMTPEPSEGPALDVWKSMLASLQKPGQHYDQIFAKRRSAVKRERANPAPMVKGANFCAAAEGEQAARE